MPISGKAAIVPELIFNSYEMPNSCNYNCTDLPTHEQVECGDNLKGGIAGFAYLECDHTITDYSNATQWNTNINNGKAKIFKAIRGEKPEPSPVEGENPNACGGADTQVDTFDRSYEFTDYNVTAGNADVYNALNKRNGHLVVFYCEDQQVEVVEQAVNFVARDVSPRTRKEKRSYMVTAKWTAFDMPALYDAPSGIFE